ncbi:protein ImuB [Sphingobacterium allocomposti]|jgi:protein ImuB|uniref:Protein ImuB n=1 Tax=Sphingobacterium allocomposti TaxID=415956 RepID=A0A5S5DIL4_9SPHI|nr:DNA polymerase Y family protein [Sphingobacterium composti Yoo et al. 2007 non Ten et al. 2007]TYP95771.1 protein ImuB [Sphingobacterium composti Yoo et al. 2007 non Ten et al. 2007]HLS96184.1 DNA polymerase Y family protein [Sphingobacterium sp.]
MKRRFAALWFPFLLTDWYTRRRPADRDIPLVSALPKNGRMCITAANAIAQQEGVYAGMVLADAKAAVPQLIMFPDTPDRAATILKHIGLWCIKFTPLAGMDEPGGIILDITGCAHLWGGEMEYVTEIKQQLEKKGYTAKIAVADTIAAAWAMSRYAKQEIILTTNDEYDILHTLPPEALRLDEWIVQRLYKLGFKTIGRFIGMPPATLRRRFGPTLVHRINQLLGRQEEHILPIKPVAPYVERLPCLDPIRTAQGIELAIGKLLDGLCARLTKEGKGVRHAQLSCYRVDGKVLRIEIGTNKPSVSKKHLLELFELKISTIEPALGIELFLLEAVKVDDHTPHQELLWSTNGSFENKALVELLDRFKGRDPYCHINRYVPQEHHWPERAIRAAESLTEKATDTWPQHRPRPIRLLHPPQPIEVTAPIPDYPPLIFRFHGEVYVIKRADGPERIEREWWLEQGEHRDYYVVEDTRGRRYWLFRLGHYVGDRSPNWYLHGYFA